MPSTRLVNVRRACNSLRTYKGWINCARPTRAQNGLIEPETCAASPLLASPRADVWFGYRLRLAGDEAWGPQQLDRRRGGGGLLKVQQRIEKNLNSKETVYMQVSIRTNRRAYKSHLCLPPARRAPPQPSRPRRRCQSGNQRYLQCRPRPRLSYQKSESVGHMSRVRLLVTYAAAAV